MDLMTTRQVAKVLHIGEATVRRHAAAGRFPVTKVGKYYLIDRADLDKVRAVYGKPREKETP